MVSRSLGSPLYRTSGGLAGWGVWLHIPWYLLNAALTAMFTIFLRLRCILGKFVMVVDELIVLLVLIRMSSICFVFCLFCPYCMCHYHHRCHLPFPFSSLPLFITIIVTDHYHCPFRPCPCCRCHYHCHCPSLHTFCFVVLFTGNILTYISRVRLSNR